MDEVRKNRKKIDEIRTFLHLSASGIEQSDFSGMSDFKITGAKAGKISAMQGPTFKNFIKDSAKELFAYNGWFKKVGLAFVGLCAITAFGVLQIGKKNEFNPDIYEERRSA